MVEMLEVVSKPQIRLKGPRYIQRGDGVLKPLLRTIAEETSEMIIANEKRLIKQARENL